MGVEYSHGLFVSDLTYKPTWGHFQAVHEVLIKWKLAKKTGFELYDLDEDTQITAKAAAKTMPANLMAVFPTVDGKPAADLMGDSPYDLEPSERYIMAIQVVLGVDFHRLTSEEFDVDIATPPKNGKTAVASDDSSHVGQMSVFKASWTTTPPKTKATKGFNGIWRSGLILDCNKDLPSFAEDQGPLPANGFRAALEKALGTKLVEQGWYH